MNARVVTGAAQALSTEWWRDHSAIYEMCFALVNLADYTSEELLDFISKPWNWTRERTALVRFRAAGIEPTWEQVEARAFELIP